MLAQCRKCSSTGVRASRFRAIDVLWLLFLQLPVRCRDCGERTYAFCYLVFKLPAEPASRHRH
jgi:hypothetical protein